MKEFIRREFVLMRLSIIEFLIANLFVTFHSVSSIVYHILCRKQVFQLQHIGSVEFVLILGL